MNDFMNASLGNINRTINYIINRNEDIVFNSDCTTDLKSIESLATINGCEEFVIFIDNIGYKLDCFTTIEDAYFIWKNTDKITYLYSVSNSIDSVIGRLSRLFYNLKIDQTDYIDMILHYNCNFTKKDIYSYFKG
jgi:hypothetical protein